jgi:hypothetical protein
VPVIPATQEAEIRRITVRSHSGQIVCFTLSRKNHRKKGLKVSALSSNLSTAHTHTHKEKRKKKKTKKNTFVLQMTLPKSQAIGGEKNISKPHTISCLILPNVLHPVLIKHSQKIKK